MESKEKKHHHFVPQVYLKNFAHTIEKKGNKDHYYVSTFDKIDEREESKTDIEKICLKKKLYTIDSDKRQERESIENLYANTIESDYPKFYNIITDEKKFNISKEERGLIILTIINLQLRNPYLLNSINDFWMHLINTYNYPDPLNVFTEKGKILFPFETKSIDEIITDNKKENKQFFINEHLKLTFNLVKSHFNDIIFVDTDKSDVGFITSDRPVLCNDIASPFRLPINRNFMLTIMPNKENIKYDISKIIRNNPFINARTFNILQYENATRQIIGLNLDDINLSKQDYIKIKNVI
ncbi:MAG: DUF4238 domain-containing protein [Bacteroidota bacterium]